MKEEQTDFPLHPSTELPFLSLQSIRIATNLTVSSQFMDAPGEFCRNHQIQLIENPTVESTLRSRYGDRPEGGKKTDSHKLNFEFVTKGGLRILVETRDDQHILRNITIHPSVLLRGIICDALLSDDLERSLELMRSQLSPLLADPADQDHLTPGIITDCPISYWSGVEMEAFFPDLEIPCLHQLSHPFTGDAAGTKKQRIALSSQKQRATITFKRIRWKKLKEQDEAPSGGIRVRLTLKNELLVSAFTTHGTVAKIERTPRIVDFPPQALAKVHQQVLSRMSGFYLPVPSDWRNPAIEKKLTAAKTLALASVLTGTPVSEVTELDSTLRSPSRRTKSRIESDTLIEQAKLTPIDVGDIFPPSAYPDLSDQTTN